MKNIWLTTDTHFNHDKIKTYCQRPDDFTQRIINNWRRLVQPDDVVIHLGDVIIGKKSNLPGIMEQLPGRKILVRGNHDRESLTWYMNHGFALAVESLVLRDALLTHHPQMELPPNASINIHGHYHNTTHHHWEFEQRPFHRLLAIEYTNYCPVLFDKFVQTALPPSTLYTMPRTTTVLIPSMEPGMTLRLS